MTRGSDIILPIHHHLISLSSMNYINSSSSLAMASSSRDSPSMLLFLSSSLHISPLTASKMDRKQLQHQVAYMRKSLFDQGYLDDQFNQLEDLQDEANPNFVEEVVTLFYSDSARFIQNIEQAMIKKPNIDFGKLDDYMHQFKGSSSSFGAKKMKKECSQFRECCSAGNIEGCIKTFQQLKQEHATLRRKLETYFQLVKQAGIAGRT